MKVRKRSWIDAHGKKHSAYFADFVDPKSGKRKRKVLPGITKQADAERVAYRRFETLHLSHALGKSADPTDAQKLRTLEMLFTRDLLRPGVSGRTLALDKHRHERLKRILGAKTSIRELTLEKLERYQTERKAEGCGARGINGEMATLKAAIRRAIATDYIHENMLLKFPENLPETTKRRRALTKPEVAALIRGCKGLPTGAKLADTITVLVYTGMRLVSRGQFRQSL